MKNVLKTIGYWLSLPFVLLITLLKLLSAKRKAKKYKKDPNSIFAEDRLKTAYKLFNKFFYIKRVEFVAEGFENLPTKQMLFIANHKDVLDPMVLFNALSEKGKLGEMSFIAKYELSKHWYTRSVINLIDGIFIKRDDGRSIYDCYLKQTENIKKGFSIAVFPEGTRVPGDSFKQFQPATLKVAFENFIAIAPIVIYGADKKRKTFQKKKVYITALKPVQPNNFINIKQEQLMASLQNSIEEKYNELKQLHEEGK